MVRTTKASTLHAVGGPDVRHGVEGLVHTSLWSHSASVSNVSDTYQSPALYEVNCGLWVCSSATLSPACGQNTFETTLSPICPNLPTFTEQMTFPAFVDPPVLPYGQRGGKGGKLVLDAQQDWAFSPGCFPLPSGTGLVPDPEDEIPFDGTVERSKDWDP